MTRLDKNDAFCNIANKIASHYNFLQRCTLQYFSLTETELLKKKLNLI